MARLVKAVGKATSAKLTKLTGCAGRGISKGSSTALKMVMETKGILPGATQGCHFNVHS